MDSAAITLNKFYPEKKSQRKRVWLQAIYGTTHREQRVLRIAQPPPSGCARFFCNNAGRDAAGTNFKRCVDPGKSAEVEPWISGSEFQPTSAGFSSMNFGKSHTGCTIYAALSRLLFLLPAGHFATRLHPSVVRRIWPHHCRFCICWYLLCYVSRGVGVFTISSLPQPSREGHEKEGEPQLGVPKHSMSPFYSDTKGLLLFWPGFGYIKAKIRR